MSSGRRILEVPGNLLLAGEYAITLEGYSGVTFAAGPPVRVHMDPAPQFRLRGRFGRQGARSGRTGSVAQAGAVPTDNSVEDSPVFSAALALFGDRSRFAAIASRATDSGSAANAVGRRAAFESAGVLPPVAITVDSSGLFTPEGRKLGFGSSAAATVATVAALLAAVDIDPVNERSLTAMLATVAHRDLQGGAGSGYDVATSCFGGVGLFTGGERPTYERIDAGWLPPLGVTSGPSAESSAGAVARFRYALETDTTHMNALLEQSNRAVSAIAAAREWDDGRRAFEAARDVGIRIGEAIGVPAAVGPEYVYGGDPGDCGKRFMKALGAGRETIGLLPYRSDCRETRVPRDTEGLRWA